MFFFLIKKEKEKIRVTCQKFTIKYIAVLIQQNQLRSPLRDLGLLA
jgi:predicted ABC-class ATPase